MKSVASNDIFHWPRTRLERKQRRLGLCQFRNAESRKPLRAAVQADFAATRKTLEQKKLPAAILARHDRAVAQLAPTQTKRQAAQAVRAD